MPLSPCIDHLACARSPRRHLTSSPQARLTTLEREGARKSIVYPKFDLGASAGGKLHLSTLLRTLSLFESAGELRGACNSAVDYLEGCVSLVNAGQLHLVSLPVCAELVERTCCYSLRMAAEWLGVEVWLPISLVEAHLGRTSAHLAGTSMSGGVGNDVGGAGGGAGGPGGGAGGGAGGGGGGGAGGSVSAISSSPLSPSGAILSGRHIKSKGMFRSVIKQLSKSLEVALRIQWAVLHVANGRHYGWEIEAQMQTQAGLRTESRAYDQWAKGDVHFPGGAPGTAPRHDAPPQALPRFGLASVERVGELATDAADCRRLPADCRLLPLMATLSLPSDSLRLPLMVADDLFQVWCSCACGSTGRGCSAVSIIRTCSTTLRLTVC